MALFNQWALMSCSMSAQYRLLVYIISVRSAASYVQQEYNQSITQSHNHPINDLDDHREVVDRVEGRIELFLPS